MTLKRRKMMSGFVGGIVTCGGFLKMFDVLSKGSHYLGRDVRGVEVQNDSKCKQISRIVANIFTLIGQFYIAIGMITMGATLYSASPAIAFITALNEGLAACAPYLVTTLATLSLGLIIRQIAR